jgi:hypothetical protein
VCVCVCECVWPLGVLCGPVSVVIWSLFPSCISLYWSSALHLKGPKFNPQSHPSSPATWTDPPFCWHCLQIKKKKLIVICSWDVVVIQQKLTNTNLSSSFHKPQG